MQLGTGAQHGMFAVDAIQRSAAGPWFAFVATAPACVTEIGTASFAEAHCRPESPYCAVALAARLSDWAITGNSRTISGCCAASAMRQCAQPQALWPVFNGAELPRQVIDIHDSRWPHNIQLHQIKQGSAPAKNVPPAFTASAASLAGRTGKAASNLIPHPRRGVLNRGQNIGIGGTAAQIAAHIFADFIIAADMALLDTRHRGHDLTRGAIAALRERHDR